MRKALTLEGKKVTAVETQYAKRSGDGSGLLECMEKHGLRSGIVVARQGLGRKKTGNKEILFIPAWLFLLLV